MPSWIDTANAADCDFPLQNLPFGVFSKDGEAPRCCTAIGDRVLDLAALEGAGLIRAGGIAPVFTARAFLITYICAAPGAAVFGSSSRRNEATICSGDKGAPSDHIRFGRRLNT